MQPTALPAPLPSERGASGGACTRAEILSRIIYHGKQKRHRIFTKSLPNIRCFCGFCLKYLEALSLRRGQQALLAALPQLGGEGDDVAVHGGGAASNTENGDFYGVNAALLATNGASVTITNAKITSSAQNGNGVFSYGSGTTVNIANSVITTTADNSGGIQTTGDIVVDTISTLNMKLTNGSSFTGAINIVDNAQSGAAVSDNAAVTIDSGCTWTLTGNCTLTSLTNNGTIHFNGYTITLADGTVLG